MDKNIVETNMPADPPANNEQPNELSKSNKKPLSKSKQDEEKLYKAEFKKMKYWIFPKETISRKNNSKDTNSLKKDEKSYLFTREKEILDMWLVPEIEEKKENKDYELLQKKRKNIQQKSSINKLEDFRYNSYINKILGLQENDIQYLDYIDKTVKELANRKMNLIDKKFLLLKYFQVKKAEEKYKNFYSLVKAVEERDEEKRKYLANNPEYLYEEEEELEDEDFEEEREL